MSYPDTMLETNATPATLVMQVSDDVERLKRVNKVLSEWITKMANKLWIYANDNRLERAEKHPTPVEPNLQSLRYLMAEQINEYEELVENLYSILQKL